MQTTPENFGQWVRERRKQRGLTQKALGKLTGYAEITVRQIESNQYHLTRFAAECFVTNLMREGDDPDSIMRVALKQTSGTDNDSQAGSEFRAGAPFVGRDNELKRIMELIHNPSCRCISIVGVGGIGKTRLAAQAFAALKHSSFQETFFIYLTEASTAEQMARTIAAGIGIALTPFGTATEQFVPALADRRMLLFLDNFEQLLPEGLVLLTEMIDRAPEIKLILTSRESLQISSEWSVRLHGLGMTNESSLSDAQNLFLSIAQRRNHLFVPTDLDSITLICRLLQGIPLAIEIAASWTDIYTCSEILSSVTSKALDLTSRYQDIDERHRSLQAVFETTWDQLSGRERGALMRLAIFHNGFTIAAARKVALADDSVIPFLQDKMLVQPYADGRLVLHEMVRQFALRKLMEDKTELRDASLSHAEHYVQLLAQSAEHIKYGSARDEIAHLSTEFENMMAAWNTLLAERRADWFDRCWEGIWFFFNITSRFREGETLFRSAAASFGIHEMRLEETHVRDFSLVLAACFLMRRARISDASSVLADPQIGAIRSSEIPLDRFYFSSIQSYIFHAMGDAQAALAAAEVALDASRSLEKDFFAQVTTYFQIGRVYSLLGNSTLAHEYLSDSLRLFKEYRIGWGADLVVTEMGIVAETSGRIEEALAYYEAVLAGVTEWEEAWNYHRTRISIARLKFGLNHTQEALEILQATLQSLDKNPQLGLEVDCFVEIALVLKHYNETPLAYVLLEYCSTHPDCFHSTRDRAVAYLSTIKTEVPAIQVTLARNLFPHNKNEVLEMLLDHLSKIRSNFASP